MNSMVAGGESPVGLDRFAAWTTLRELSRRPLSLRALFAEDPRRGEQLIASVDGLTLDYSRHLVDTPVLDALHQLAREAHLSQRFADMIRGRHVNRTEDRAALHAALRSVQSSELWPMFPPGATDLASAELNRLRTFAREVRDGERVGATGKRIRNVVNVGIGGSDLGPALFADTIRTLRAATGIADPITHARFVSNVDGVDLRSALADLDPAETLFVVVSKTFTTVETLTNANAARRWLAAALGEHAVARHFVAVSTNVDRVQSFGIDPQNMFVFWDWVGGRYSLPSAAGLAAMLALGPETFDELLAGMRRVDEHMSSVPSESNVAILMGLLGVWCRNALGAASHAVIPYARALTLLPAYLQQLEMESNGKRVTNDGRALSAGTAPVVWGTPGTNGQHAYFQLLHQGTDLVSIDLIGSLRPMSEAVDQHEMLMASLLAQARAFAFGRPAGAEVAAHRAVPGNRPCSIVMLDQLDAAGLGSVIACYEYRVFVMGVLWDIDSFDQWGVELGKELATSLLGILRGSGDARHTGNTARDGLDSSTAMWLDRLRATRTAN